MGLQATQITDPQDLGDALKAAMASGRPNLIEVFVADGFGT
jgi:thiamine pyrophosphate-dependent acetolactate synthase large subunit-like protein